MNPLSSRSRLWQVDWAEISVGRLKQDACTATALRLPGDPSDFDRATNDVRN